VTPVLLLAFFITFYSRFQAGERAAEARAAEAASIKQAADAKAQSEMEARLDEEARKLAAAKAEAEAKKEAEARAENEKKIVDLTVRLTSVKKEIDSFNERNATLDEKITSVRAERLKTEARWLAEVKEIEEIRAEKSLAETESQRLMGVVMDRYSGAWKEKLSAPAVPAK
jgi:membrane protein involved in colicin uptake